MGVVKNLLVRVGADLTDLQKKLKLAQKMFKDLGKDLNKIGEGLTKKITVPIVAVASAFTAMGLKAAKSADDLADLSMVTNIGVEDLQAYAYAGDILGTNLDTITGAQTKLTRSVAEAHGGNKDAIKSFQELGVSIYDTEGKLRTADEIFWDVLDSLGRIEDPIVRDALAMQLMGKSAQDLNPLIKAGSEEIKKYMDRARELGLVMSEEQITTLANLNDAWSTLKFQLSAAGSIIAAALAPAMQQLIDLISEKLPLVTKEVEELVNKFLELDPATQSTVLTAIGLVAALGPLVLILGKLATGLSGIMGWALGVTKAIVAVGQATGSVGSVIVTTLGGTAVAVVAVIAVIAGLIVIFKHLWQTNEEFKTAVIAIWESIKSTMMPILQGIWDFVTLVFTEISTFITDNMGTVLEIISNTWLLAKEIFTIVLEAIVGNISYAIEAIKIMWDLWGDFLLATIEFAWNGIKTTIEFVLNVISGIIKVILGVITGDWEKAWDGVKQIFVSVLEGMLGVAQNIFGLISGIVMGIIEKVSAAIQAVKELLNLGNPTPAVGLGTQALNSVSKIPKLANGGILTSPTLAIAGEAGPEAVIPLSKLDTMLGTGSKETIVQVILDGRVIQEFIDSNLGRKSFAVGGGF